MIYPSRAAVMGAWLALIVALLLLSCTAEGEVKYIRVTDLEGRPVICNTYLTRIYCTYEGE